jgi:hypothetical protein
VPGYANPQNLNRYSYVLNNPIRYNDPSGHIICDGIGTNGCDQSGIPATRGQLISVLRSSGVKLKGKWKDNDAYAVYLGVTAVGEKLARTLGGSAESAFQKVFKDGINLIWGGGDNPSGQCASVTSGGCTSSASQINFWSMSNDMVKNVVHELGHAFYHTVGNPLLGNSFSRDALIRNLSYASGEVLVWEQHPISMNDPQEDIPTELFADTFIAWTYDTWNPDPSHDIALAVNNAQTAMDNLVP